VRRAQRIARDESGRLSSTATDIVRNVRVVQAFQRQTDSLGRFAERNSAATDTSISSMRVDARFSPLSNLVLSIGSAIVLYVGVLRVQQGRMTVGTLLIVLSYVGSVYGPVRSLSRLATSLARGAASKDRLLEVLASEDQLPVPARPVRVDRVTHALMFDHVSFGYEPDVPVIDEASFAIYAGEHFCIVGPTGAGKSTLLQLLLRMYDPTEGRITLDGVDLRQFDLESLRNRFGLVSQQPWMLDGTIADNIAFGRPDVTRAEIEILGRFALIDEFVDRFPLGYDTPVGEGGARLSGGQLRRIAFARAIVRLPDVLLLDEPTSGLDAHSERQIVRAINRVRRGRTVVTVTHHLSLAEQADRVAVIERGRIVEVGAPTELRLRDGAYAALLRAADRADGLWSPSAMPSDGFLNTGGR
jgi:ATP-binding cassette subfamily B protein